MTTDPALPLEPTFKDAIGAIAAASNLPKHRGRHWRTSLSAIAKAFDQPPETIPARYSAVRARLAALHHVPMGWTLKTLANHKANTKAALLWFAREKDVLPHGMPLSPAWDRLRIQLTDPSTRYRLMPVMRFCSGLRIGPDDVDEGVIDRYFEHRSRTTARRSDTASRRILARLWNANIGRIRGWPVRSLFEPPVKPDVGPNWEEFPEGLRCDVEAYLTGLTRIRRNKAGQRIRPCKPLTIDTRRRELVAAARMAVKAGIPIERLTSLAALIHPDVAEKILDAYWRQNGEVPKSYTINLASRFVAIAHEVKSLDAAAFSRLDDMRYALEQHREEGLTEKNLALIRSVLTEGVWARVVNLPSLLMEEARSRKPHAPVGAAVLAQIAVAVAILTVAPVRLANLASVRLGENLTKPGGPDSAFWLTFPRYDVKNDVPLQFELDRVVTDIIDEYVREFRPALLRGSNGDWLFPGCSSEHKEKISFSTQIVKRIQKSTGLRVTVHQFRHAAAAILLKHRPGEYGLVQRILGHKSLETTKRFYVALEMIPANEIFADIVREHMNFGIRAH
jgi:hypothetical protein